MQTSGDFFKDAVFYDLQIVFLNFIVLHGLHHSGQGRARAGTGYTFDIQRSQNLRPSPRRWNAGLIR